MNDSEPADEEATVTYVLNAESWGQVIASTTLGLMNEYKANSAMLDQTLAGIESAEHANMNTLAAVRSSLSSANLKLPDAPARRSRGSQGAGGSRRGANSGV
jgi:hypothetical protein